LIKRHIPRADRVVDLGGACDHDQEGALFAMGYPHAPRELIIIDLPPEDRFTKPTVKASKTVEAARGTRIEYSFRSMSDLGFLPDSSVDLVVSGESIEHITEQEAEAVCNQVFRILKPGGRFCLDTPNARLTRLQSPTSLIHPEHKKEYLVSELRQMLERHGFLIVKELGINPMPNSIASQSFDYQEMTRNKHLSDDAEIGYCFYFDAVKS
jgi:SAM-dependent methyltransferase